MVVDPQSLNQSLPSDTEAVSCFHPGDRCLHSQLGGLQLGLRHKDRKNHINWLELQGACLSLPTEILTKKQGIHVLLLMDSQVVISYQQDGRYTLSEAL